MREYAWDADAYPWMDKSIRLVRFVWVDNNGIARAKAITRAAIADRMRDGVGLAVCRQVANVFDRAQPVEGFGAQGEVRATPDPSTLFPLAHAPGAAGVLCDLIDVDGQPWAACPRDFLRRTVARADALGLSILAAFEPEFTLYRVNDTAGNLRPSDNSLCFDIAGFDATHDFAIDAIDALERAGLRPEMFHPEYSPGQYELTIAPTSALRAADDFAIYRMVLRGVALRHGLGATFAAAPAPGLRGNGCHIHLSLWRDGRNVLAADDRAELSTLGRSFVAGLLKHASALVALTCPSVNSYRRLRPGMWAGGNLCFGLDDREAFVRLANASPISAANQINVELRACDGTNNPYLALGGVIAAGLDGIESGLPLSDRPDGGESLPTDLASAIAALRANPYLIEGMGERLSTSYLAVKQSDVADSASMREDEHYQFFARVH